MAYPASPVDGNTPSGFRIGMIVKKVSSTLTAIVIRCILASTGSDPVGWAAFATHVEDDPAAVSDAGSLTPGALMLGKRGAHVTVDTAGDVGALQVDATGALMVNIGTGTATISGTVTTTPPNFSGGTSGVKSVGTSQTTITTDANCRRLRVRNSHATQIIYYSFTTGVTADQDATTGGMPILPDERDEIDIGGSKIVYFIASGASTPMPFNQLTT